VARIFGLGKEAMFLPQRLGNYVTFP